MEGSIMKKQPCNLSSSTSPPLSMHKDSQTISKVKPKIRIIHIFAPEIIKTDVENFRELVQRLTGKPTEKVSKKKVPKTITRRESTTTYQQPKSINLCDHQVVAKTKVELRNGFGSFGSPRERSSGVKEEEEMMWNGTNSSGFLSGLSEIDGFIQELGEFPLLPYGHGSSCQSPAAAWV